MLSEKQELYARIDQLEMLVLVLRHLDPAPSLEVFGVINKEIRHLKDKVAKSG